MGAPRIAKSLPLQVAAVCYRRRGPSVEFLLVNTNGGNKWTFPKGCTEPRLSHSQAAAREALEEAGAVGVIEPHHFHLYLHSKGVFWQPAGVQPPGETMRNPTWFDAPEARKMLAKGRELKYAAELLAVIDRALDRIQHEKAVLPSYPEARNPRSVQPS